MEDPRHHVTRVLARPGDASSPAERAHELVPVVYEELRALAERYVGAEPANELQPTALVHEAFLKLVDQSRVDWAGRTHFFRIGALAMRRLLVDHARQRSSGRHGGGLRRVRLAEDLLPGEAGLDDERLLALDGALDRLADEDARQARCVELRYFSTLSVNEIATVFDVSRRTVERDLTHARAWLRRELT